MGRALLKLVVFAFMVAVVIAICIQVGAAR